MSAYRYAKPSCFPDLHTRHWVMEASAGTGKTYTIEHLVVALILESDLQLDQIVVVTYTEAAALELRRRIRGKLQALRDLDHDEVRPGCREWLIDEVARTRLDAALQAFDRAVISTIHAFCQRILQDGAFESGRFLRQERVSEEDLFTEVFRHQVRTRMFATEADQAFMAEAMELVGDLEVIEATLRAAWSSRAVLVPGPGDLVAVDQTCRDFPRADRRDAAQLKQTFGGAWTSISKHLVVLDQRLDAVVETPSLRNWALLADASVFKPSGKPDWHAALWREDHHEGPAKQFREALGTLRDCLPAPEAFLVQRLLPSLGEAIEARKAQDGLYDFHDMIAQVALGLDQPDLLARQQTRYRAALIDEFQDTDALQWEIFRKVFGGPDHHLIVVGDPKQAIYDFRGGDLPTYQKACRDLLGNGAHRLPLVENHRTSPALIDRLNQVLAEGEGFFQAPNGYPDPVLARCPTRLIREGEAQPPMLLLRTPTSGSAGTIRRRLARGLAATFRNVLDQGLLFDPGKADGLEPPRPLHPGDFMVLTYTGAQSQMIAKALQEAGLPWKFFKADGLFQTREALELKDLLEAVLRPNQLEARGKALLTRFFGLSLVEAESARDLPPDHPILTLLEDWHDLARQRRYPRLFNAMIEESGLVRRLLMTEDGDRSLTNIRHLLEYLTQEATVSQPSPEELVSRLGRWIRELDLPVQEESGTQRLEGQTRAVRILTIHKAKGLEAPVVAVFGGDGLRPSQAGELLRFHDEQDHRCVFLGQPGALPPDLRARVGREQVREEERKLYVAITRPKTLLILPHYVPEPGQQPNPRSNFDADGHPKGPYGTLNRRISDLLQTDEARWGPFLMDLPGPVQTRLAAPTAAVTVGLEPRGLPPTPDFDSLARWGRPLWSHSFTSLAKIFGATESGSGLDEAHEAGITAAPRPRSRGALPPGPATGVALHSLLERLPAGVFSGVGAADEATIQGLAEASLRAQGLRPELAQEALRMARAALTTPIPLPMGPPVVLDQVGQRLPEVGFHMPFPGHPDGLEGSIDLLFEWEGRLHFLDWKSNDLGEGGYTPTSVAEAVSTHYGLQVQIYTLAVLAMAGIETEETYQARYGGAVYLFLRGLPEGGIWTGRPTWAEVQAWRVGLSHMDIDKWAMDRMAWGMHG